MPSGGRRPGAGRPRKVNMQPDFEKILSPQTVTGKEPYTPTCEVSGEAAVLKEQVNASAEAMSANDTPLEQLKPLSLQRNREARDGNEVTVGRAEFTAEKLILLTNSPHVKRVTRKTVSYTKAFQEEFLKRYCDGESPSGIFASFGLDPEVIGRKRIYGFCGTLRGLISRGKPLAEDKPLKDENALAIPKRRKHQTAAEALASLSADDVYKLYQRVVYLTQELEFLKKIMLLEREEG